MKAVASVALLGAVLLASGRQDVSWAQAAPAPATFVSVEAGGNWSAPDTWTSKDLAAAKRVPGDGDRVTIKGPVTVEAAAVIGTGSGDAVVVSKGSKLVVAATLTLRGSLLLEAGATLEGKPGGGIEFDAAKDVVPMLCASGKADASLAGTAQSRFFVRTKPGSAGFAGCVQPKGEYDRLNLSAAWTDFTDLGIASKQPGGGDWGRRGVKIAAPTAPGALDHCAFLRASLEITGSADSSPVALNHVIMTDSTPQGGGLGFCARLACDPKNPNITVAESGFDRLVFIEHLKSVRSSVLAHNWFANRPKLAEEWSDTLSGSHEDKGNFGYPVPQPGTYKRCYWFSAKTTSNAHVMFLGGDKGGAFLFEQCIWDAPLSPYVDDALDHWSGQTVRVERCLSVLRAGSDIPNGRGVSMGWVNSPTTYSHNTISLGPVGLYGDVQHYGHAGDLAGFRDNLCWLPDGFGKGTVLAGSTPNWYDPANIHHNALFNADYLAPKSLNAPPAGTGDVVGQDPKFVDPKRRLIAYYRLQNKLPPDDAKSAEADALAALDWMRQRPEKVPELIDWVFAGFVPTNPALKASSDPDGPTKGWIGAMEGKP